MQHGGRCRFDGHPAGCNGGGLRTLRGRRGTSVRNRPGARLDYRMAKRTERTGGGSGDGAHLAVDGGDLGEFRALGPECRAEGTGSTP